MQQKKLRPETLAIRGISFQTEYKEHAQALFLTSSFTHDTAEEARALFLGEKKGYTYTRTANPTVAAFEQRVAQLEKAERALATATGMAAIQATFMTFLQAGDHLLASTSLFGSTSGLIAMLKQYGIEVSFASPLDSIAWENAIQKNTKMFFLESPSNPLAEIADIEALSIIAHQYNILLVVDNCFCSPAIQQPLTLGADISLQSATKAIDGHGRVMGGVICGSNELIEKVYMHVRTTGETLSPFNAWVLISGLETLYVRMEKQSANALGLALWLQKHPKVTHVYYPGLPEHPQYALIQKQQSTGGIVIAFEVIGGQPSAWKIIDQVTLFSRTGNLGDVKSTITHPYTTTHARVSDEQKQVVGIWPNLIRLSIGLEHIDDLKQDLSMALEQI